METPKKINPAIAALIVIVLIGVSTAAIVLLKNNSTMSQNTTETTTPSSAISNNASTTDPPGAPSQTKYTDGTYDAQGTYITPGGRESVGLTVTLKDGVIVNTTLDQQASDREAVEYQQRFASKYKAQVVGKNINDVQLSRVAGSSLTSNGFNDAIEQIRTDASA
jgi:uncharacterized protein with FMN-binding domain